MNTKHWALFFVCILSSEFINSVSAGIRGEKDRCCKRKPRKPRNAVCTLKPECVTVIDECLERARVQIPDSFDLDDTNVEEYQMTDGVASGFKNYKRISLRCICGRNFVRIFINISFLRILVTYVLSLVEGLLGGLLGSLGSALSRVLGNVVDLLIRVLCLDIIVQITILQRFIPGTKCVLESFTVTKLENITLLGLNLRPIARLLSPLLAPVLDLVLQLIFTGRVRAIFVKEFEKLIITRDMVLCP